MLTVTTLASGSSGNAALVSCGKTHILLDAGISARRITTGLKALGVDPQELAAILVTHDHQDHIAALAVLTKKLRCPIYASGQTGRRVCMKVPFVDDLVREQVPGTGLEVGELWVESFSTPHDAPGSVGYSITGAGRRMVLATDLGHITPQVTQMAAGCDLLLCEANHDEDWVRSGPYPYQLKQRVLGDMGHLCNEAGAELAALAVQSGTRAVVLAHLSAENNTPAHAYQVVARRLRGMDCDPEGDISLAVAPRAEVGPTYCLDRTGDITIQRRAAVC